MGRRVAKVASKSIRAGNMDMVSKQINEIAEALTA